MELFIGVVEDNKDPLRIGRVKVRVFSLHSENKTQLPTVDLPWFAVMSPTTSASISGIGYSATGLLPGSWVIVTFLDADKQNGLVLGSLLGIPQQETRVTADEDEITLFSPLAGGTSVTTNQQNPITDNQGKTIADPEQAEVDVSSTQLIGPLSEDDYDTLKEHIANKESGSITNGSINFSQTIPANPGQNYGVISPLGYVGKYQIGAEALTDLNYLKKNNNNIVPNSAIMLDTYWTGKNGIDTYQKFLEPNSQESIMLELTKINFKRLRQFGVIKSDATKADVAGWLSACHNRGYGACIALAKQNKDIDDGVNPLARERYNDAFNIFAEGDTAPKDFSSTNQTPVGEIADTGFVSQGYPQELEKRSNIGFSDPNHQFPLSDYLNEPDTNKLARSVVRSTIVELKDKTAVKAIPVSTGTSWDQPAIPFNAKYPYNHVFQSVSGHLQEFDDTPNNERIHTYHKSGTYSEIDVNGTRVDYIVGDTYSIQSRNGYVYVKGTANITIDGDCNLLVRSAANISVNGSMNVAATDVTVSATNNMNLVAGSSIKIKADSIDIDGNDDIGLKTTKINLNATDINHNGTTRLSSLKIPTGYKADILNLPSVGSPNGNANSVNLTPSSVGEQLSINFEPLRTPERDIEEEMIFESEEENDSDNTIVSIYKQKQDTGTIAESENNTLEETTPNTNSVNPVPSNCSLIFAMDNFPRNFQLSTHFNYSEIVSPHHVLHDQFVGSKLYTKQEIMCNLKTSCENILEPLLSITNKSSFIVTSSYRQNGILRTESKNSQHNRGQAIDIQLSGPLHNNFREHYNLIIKMSQVINFDQLLLEYRNTANGRIVWIHCSYNSQGNRQQALTLVNDHTYAQKFVLLDG